MIFFLNIIEPLENLINQNQKLKARLKKFLIWNYQLNENKTITLMSFIKNKNHHLKYNEQKHYLATNAIGELKIDFDKLIDLNINQKPSRANITPQTNAILFSKLMGENKVIPTSDWESKFIFSTGMYSVNSKNNDYLLGFLLSNAFQIQKKIFSTGTTMKGINDLTLKQIKIKDTNDNDNNSICRLLSKLICYETKMNKLKELFTNLLIV